MLLMMLKTSRPPWFPILFVIILSLGVTFSTGVLRQTADGRLTRYPAGQNAVDILRQHGHPIPSVREWWVEHPAADEVIAALVPPLEDANGICVMRFWIPREAKGWDRVDRKLLQEVLKTPSGPHHLALKAHLWEAQNEPFYATRSMQDARNWYFDESRDSRVYCPFRSRHLLALVFALDWIKWEDPAQFERAFERARSQIRNAIREHKSVARGIVDDGYWFAGHPIETPYFVEQLLAIGVCNVNPDGRSSQWANARLQHLGTPLEKDDQSLYSSFKLANVLSLLSRRGGGREFGQQEAGPGLGGYERYFAAGGIIQLEALDTATDRKWQLRNRNLYFRTRQLGLQTEIDTTVAKTNNSPTGDSIISILARFFRDEPEVGGLYQWCLGDSPNLGYFKEFIALAGQAPPPAPPAPHPLVDHVGSRWHYRENPTEPDSTFRLWIVKRDIDNFRYAPDERCLSFCIGNIGLVDGQANRTMVVGALANGVHFSRKTPDGEPYVADSNFWATSSTHHPYWSSRRAFEPEQVLEDPYYLMGEDGPVEKQGIWTWTRDYSQVLTRVIKSGIQNKIQVARAAYRFIPHERKLEIIDTISAQNDIYIGWHFSPTHPVMLHENGFQFGDGKDLIRVQLEGIEGTELEVKRRKQWKHDGYTLPLDWHETVGGPRRIAENIGYTPREPRSEYKVRVVIQANPKD